MKIRQYTSILFLIGLTMLPVVTRAESDAMISAMAKSVLEYMGINVSDVKLADGTANGGVRSLIITYKYTTGDEGARLAELVKILELGTVMNKKYKARINEVAAVAGNWRGDAAGIISIKAAEAKWFTQTKDSLGYLKKWNVALFRSDFLPNTALNMGW